MGNVVVSNVPDILWEGYPFVIGTVVFNSEIFLKQGAMGNTLQVWFHLHEAKLLLHIEGGLVEQVGLKKVQGGNWRCMVDVCLSSSRCMTVFLDLLLRLGRQQGLGNWHLPELEA